MLFSAIFFSLVGGGSIIQWEEEEDRRKSNFLSPLSFSFIARKVEKREKEKETEKRLPDRFYRECEKKALG